jgi:multidrug efflux pump subunit AcrA (membrane-fusion protein)
MNFESTIARRTSDMDYLTDDEISARRKRRNLIIAVVVIVAVIAVAWTVMSGSAAKVTIISPAKQLVTMTISATGSLAARREMPVGVAGEGGMVSKVWVEPGDWVRQGQVLASIERSVQS